MSELKTVYRTVVISDVHLGIKDSKVRELTEFLKQHPCKKLVLNGDIIDGWRLQKNGKWRRRHTRFIKYLIKISSKTKIIYIRGNHDDFLDQMVPIGFGNFRVVNSYSMKSGNKKYYIVHGDAFDNITRWVVWVSKFGASSYDILLTINRMYNNYRRRRGLGYKSISKGLKSNVKIVTSLISNFEGKAVLLAKNMGYDGIICGHIHTTADKMIDGVHYLNSGDWVETMSALVEDFDGNWHIKHYEEPAESVLNSNQVSRIQPETIPERPPDDFPENSGIELIRKMQQGRRSFFRLWESQKELVKK